MYYMSAKELNSKEREVKTALVTLNFNSQIKDIWVEECNPVFTSYLNFFNKADKLMNIKMSPVICVLM